MSAWNNPAPSRRVFMKFGIWIFFGNLSRIFILHYNLTRMTGTLHEDQNIFLILSRLLLLRMRNVSDKSCRVNQNTHFIFNYFFSPKIVLLMRFFHSVICLTTGPKPPPKRCLHIVRSRASSFKWEYDLLCLRSSSSFLRLLPRLLATSTSPFIFPLWDNV